MNTTTELAFISTRKQRRPYRVTVTIGDRYLVKDVRAFTAKQAESFLAKIYFGNSSMIQFMCAEPLDERFYDKIICPYCGYSDPHCLPGQIPCPNCGYV